MKFKIGNTYAVAKPIKGKHGCMFRPGAICHYVGDNNMLGYNECNVYCEVDMEQDLTGAFVLYEESPHNAHMRDVRERAIISCMQGILSNPKWPECSEGSFYKSNVVGNAISYADYLIEQLDKENE